MTLAITKHLLAVYDKPMIYYPLTTLMELGIRDILIIAHPQDLDAYQRLLSNGERFGIKIQYKIQQKPEVLAKNILMSADFINDDSVCIILGDNFFHTPQLKQVTPTKDLNGAAIFTYPTTNPSEFGILICDNENNPIRIEEKPESSTSNAVVTGLYFYGSDLVSETKNNLEFNVTDINNLYLQAKRLSVTELAGQWFDLGTADALLTAGEYVKHKQLERGQLIASPEWIAWQNKYIDKHNLESSIELFQHASYGKTLQTLYLLQGA